MHVGLLVSSQATQSAIGTDVTSPIKHAREVLITAVNMHMITPVRWLCQSKQLRLPVNGVTMSHTCQVEQTTPSTSHSDTPRT